LEKKRNKVDKLLIQVDGSGLGVDEDGGVGYRVNVAGGVLPDTEADLEDETITVAN
jgi:hypothetical protein